MKIRDIGKIAIVVAMFVGAFWITALLVGGSKSESAAEPTASATGTSVPTEAADEPTTSPRPTPTVTIVAHDDHDELPEPEPYTPAVHTEESDQAAIDTVLLFADTLQDTSLTTDEWYAILTPLVTEFYCESLLHCDGEGGGDVTAERYVFYGDYTFLRYERGVVGEFGTVWLRWTAFNTDIPYQVVRLNNDSPWQISDD